MDSDQENQATTASEDNPSSNSSESSVDTQKEFSKLSVDELKSKLKAVSYTHLTLPTNREV